MEEREAKRVHEKAIIAPPLPLSNQRLMLPVPLFHLNSAFGSHRVRGAALSSRHFFGVPLWHVNMEGHMAKVHPLAHVCPAFMSIMLYSMCPTVKLTSLFPSLLLLFFSFSPFCFAPSPLSLHFPRMGIQGEHTFVKASYLGALFHIIHHHVPTVGTVGVSLATQPMFHCCATELG